MSTGTDVETYVGEVFEDYFEKKKDRPENEPIDNIGLAILVSGQHIVDRLKNLENLLERQN